jgi:mono/diheme cytochrome c family protein
MSDQVKLSTEFKPIELAKSMENRILIGLACITGTIILLGWMAINENARMEEFTQRAEARSIEQGAKIYGANCTSCHGNSSYGLAGVGPALNSPVFFGFSFFAEIDAELALLESQLASAVGEDREALQLRQAELQAERLALEERILYHWTDEVAAFEAQIDATDQEILALGVVDSPARLPSFISRSEETFLLPLENEQTSLETSLAALPAEEAAAEGDSTEAAATEEEAAAEEEAETALECAFLTDPAASAPGAAQVDMANRAAIEARLAELETQIAGVEACLKPAKDLSTERSNLVAKRGRFQALVDAQAEVERLRAEIGNAESSLALLPVVEEGQADPDAEQRQALINTSAQAQTDLEAAISTRQAAYDELVSNADIVHYDPNQEGRLTQVGWTSTLADYIEGTLNGGRPTSGQYWPAAMVAWSQRAGGPLRVDQINNLVLYISNYESNWTAERAARDLDGMIADARKVQQWNLLSMGGAPAGGEGGEAVATTDELAIQTEIAARVDAGEIMPSAETGQEVFVAYGCTGCHGQANGTGPALVGQWTRVQEDQDGRLTDTNHIDNPEAYLIQSIVNPGAYVVPGFNSGIMPANFSERITYEEMAHLLAYLETQNQ